MKLPNGYGSVYKLSGKRRNPYIVRKTAGWIMEGGKAKQQYITIGYYPTRSDALQALAQYNENPYDIDANSVTFADVFDLYLRDNEFTAPYLRTLKSAYTYCEPLYNMRFKDIRVSHMENAIKNADIGGTTKARMKSVFNLLFKYAMKHEIVEKDYAALFTYEKPPAKIQRKTFTDAEIRLLWSSMDIPFTDMVLIGIYTGLRPQEIATLKASNYDADNKVLVCGLKTDAGKNRVVPILEKIVPLIEARIKEGNEYIFGDVNTYDRYRRKFEKIMKFGNMEHTMHDTRHTFITEAKRVHMDEYILKMIVGHAIKDVTEKVYTHRKIEELHEEIKKIGEL